MARFRHYSAHRKTRKGCSGIYLIGLLLLLVFSIWLLTVDLANTSLLNWTSNSGYKLPEKQTKLYLDDEVLFATTKSDSIIWMSYPLSNKNKEQWLTDYVKPLTSIDSEHTDIFVSNQLGKVFGYSLHKDQIPIWNEYVKQSASWTMLCDSVFIVFGNLKEETDPGKLFVANFCLSEQARSIAYLFPHQPTDKAIFEFAITVDSLESISKIDFFGDILTRPVEEEVESNMQRLLWPNSMEFYQQRMEENQLLE